MNLVYNLNPNSKLVTVNLTDDTQVNSGGSSNTQTLTPPTGYIYIIRDIYYNAPAPVGDTSGTHELVCKRTFVSSDRTIFTVKGNHSTTVWISYGAFGGDSSEVPSTASEQMKNCSDRLYASNDYPIKFVYTNDTDANQTGTRVLEILVEVKPER